MQPVTGWDISNLHAMEPVTHQSGGPNTDLATTKPVTDNATLVTDVNNACY